MAILRIALGEVDRETYDRLVDALEIATDHPLGLIMHGAAEVNGLMSIAQIWDSLEYAETFGEERLKPTLESLGIPPARQITLVELTDLVTP